MRRRESSAPNKNRAKNGTKEWRSVNGLGSPDGARLRATTPIVNQAPAGAAVSPSSNARTASR
ncbi:hypothetical protein N4G37_13380, partial [Enterococcus faecalis]|uniref:hypothetical protein n=1 Tax=Enterococcus faecalis TaxID=1351 RepID=UPI0021B0C1AB